MIRNLTVIAVCVVAVWDWCAVILLALAVTR